MKKIILYMLAISFCNSCSSYDPFELDVSTENNGNISGKVTSQNGVYPMGGAHVFAIVDDQIYNTYSDPQGKFDLEIPEGKTKLYIQTGTGANFRTDLDIEVLPSQSTAIPEAKTRLKQVAKLGYTLGTFDNIQDVLSEMGYTLDGNNNPFNDLNAYDELSNLEQISKYDIIYFGAGQSLSATSLNPTLFKTLSAYVANGGNVYAANFSANFLVGGVVYPTDCNMVGGFLPKDKLCVKWQYNTSNPRPASQILDKRMSSAVGFSDTEIELSYGSDSYIYNYDPQYWETMIKGSERSYLIKSKNYTDTTAPVLKVGNAANDGWETICLTKNTTKYTLRLPKAQADKLIAQGAQLGSCEGNTKSGTIYYTVFNSFPDAFGPNNDTNMKILKYFIFDF